MKNIMLLATLIFVTGCAATTGLDKNAKLDNPKKEAIIVFGVKPETFHINIMKGKVVNGKFEHSAFVTPTAWVAPSKGYVVLKVPVLQNDETYSIIRVGEGLLNKVFQCDWPAVTFNPKAGKINYIADLSYSRIDDNIHLKGKISSNSSAAKEFTNTNYPNLNSDFVNTGYKFRTVTNTKCVAGYKTFNPIEYVK